MEYGVPAPPSCECVRELRSFIDASGLLIQVPVEVRFVAGDDIPLSMASGRDSAFSPCHVFQGRGYEQYFHGVERIMAAAGGRPHWGKLHFQTAETLAPRYPDWSKFQAVRDQVDPQRVSRTRTWIGCWGSYRLWSVAAIAQARPSSGSSTARRNHQPVLGS